MKEFFKSILNPESASSVRRFATLMSLGFFCITSLLVVFFVFYLVLFTPKGAVNIDLLGVLKDILEYHFYIILAGSGLITIDALGRMMVERVKAKVQGNIITGFPNTDTINVETMTKADTVNAEKVDTVNTNTTNIEKSGD
jgi:hypothetical protein